MKYKLVILFIISCMLPAHGASGEFSEKEKTVIYTHSLNLLKEFQGLVNEIGVYAVNDMEAAQSSSEAFLELFVNRQVLIYNDLDPAHQLSPFYEAETYISNLLLWYHDGMDIDMDFDNARVGNIMEHELDVYSLDILVDKQINGNYLNRTPNKNREKLLFRIAFSTKGTANYKIVGIRNASSDFKIDYSNTMAQVNSEVLNENEQIQINDGIKALLNDYTNFLSLLSDPSELEDDKNYYRESFTNLFKSDLSRVFNDLEPDPSNYLLSIDEYLNLLSIGYGEGINNLSMNTDSVSIANVIKNEDGSYYTHASVTKFFSGVYQGEEVFREMFPLGFKLGFEKSGNAFINYRIESIDIETDDYYQTDEGEQNQQLPAMEITTISRKGWSLSFFGGYGYSIIDNQSIQAPSADYDADTWEINPGYGYRAGIQAHLYFNDHLALITGLSFNNYQGMFRLAGEFTDSELSQDINGDNYNKVIQADYDSALSHSYIDIPILFNYTSSKPGKFGFYIEAGASLAYSVSSSYEASGDYQLYGYYPDHPPVTQYLELEELGFYADQNIFRTGDPGIGKLNISGYLGLGITIPLGYFSSFKLGPEIYYGLSDINADIESMNIYGRPVSHETTVLKKYGVKFSYVLKL